jgi:guanosine-3',5'-bis(diphosphate) 3'-pyrophosphohydrolase
MNKGELLDKALLIATTAHHGVLDKGGSPYILHPIAVMHLLDTTDEGLQCIALLHDVVEDTDITYADLRQQGMTDRVIEGVRSMTKMRGQTLQEYKEQVFSNKDAMLVKLCDLRHNSDFKRLKGITTKDIDRMAKYQVFYFEIQQQLRERNV